MFTARFVNDGKYDMFTCKVDPVQWRFLLRTGMNGRLLLPMYLQKIPRNGKSYLQVTFQNYSAGSALNGIASHRNMACGLGYKDVVDRLI